MQFQLNPLSTTPQTKIMKKLKYAIGEILMGFAVFLIGVIFIVLFIISLIPIWEMKPRKKCQKCGSQKKLTRHHVWPRCFYKGRGPIVHLCRNCHNEIEIKIMSEERRLSSGHLEGGRYQLSRAEYMEILTEFMK